MRSAAVSALFALVAVQQAAATFGHSQSGDWSKCAELPSIKVADNECTDQQKQSFIFATANLKQGACSEYNGIDLDGWSFGAFPHAKVNSRDLFKRTTGHSSSGNCLNGKAKKNSGPSLTCGSKIPKKKASISNFQVSVEKDTHVQFVHHYEGSSQTCSYTKKCTAGGPNHVDNTQCGGSTSVTCQLPHDSPHESCDIGVHAINFDCTPAQHKSPPSSSSVVKSSEKQTHPATVPIGTAPGNSNTPPSPSIPNTTPVLPSFPTPSGSAPAFSSSAKNGTTPVVPTVPAPSSPAPSSPAPSAPASSLTPSGPGSSVSSVPGSSPTPSGPGSSVSSVPASSPAPSAPGPSSAPSVPASSPAPSAPSSSPAPSAPATSSVSQEGSSSVPQSTVEKVTSEVVYSTVTSCPVTNTHTVGSTTSLEVTTTVSTVKVTSVTTICTKCVAPTTESRQLPSSSAAPPASSPAPPASSPAPPASSPSQAGSSSVSAPPASSPAPPASSPAAPASSPSQLASSSVPGVPALSAPAPPQTTQEVVTTAVVYTTLTTCPVTNTVTPPHGTPIQQVTTTVSTVTSTSISTVCTKCVAPPASSAPASPASSIPVPPGSSPAPPASSAPVPSGSSPAPPASSAPSQQGSSVAPPPASSSPASVASSSAPPAASPSAPGVLPSCVKTWVTVTKCKDNSDYDCYCKDDTFTQNVFECIESWESEQAAQQAAFSFYAGICAPHVPEHPAIVTAVPSTITLVPTPAATPAPQGSSPEAPAPNGASSAPGSPVQEAASAPAAPITPGVTSAPAVPAPAGSSPVPAPVAPVAAAGTTPAPAAGALPPTTIHISTTVTLPCSAVGIVGQAADGQVQASGPATCTTTSLLETAVTVPQVAFTTGASSSVGLAAGTPAPAQAAATGSPAVGGAPGIPGVAAGSSSAIVAAPTSVTPFTGAAVKAGPSFAVIFGVVAMAIIA